MANLQHRNIPDAELHEAKGAFSATAGQVLTATGSGTAVFETPLRVGFKDISDSATATTPITLSTAGTAYRLTNNGAGAQSLASYQLPEMASIWNTSTNQFDFNALPLGTMLELRIDIEVASVSANTNLNLYLALGTGGGAYQVNIDDVYCKSAGTYKVTRNLLFYIGNTNTQANPGVLWIKSDTGSPTVKVHGWYIKATIQ